MGKRRLWLWLPAVVLGAAILFSLVYTHRRVHERVDLRVPSLPGLPEERGLSAQRVAFFSQGMRLSAWWFPPRGRRTTVVAVHGYGYPRGGKASLLKLALPLSRQGYGLFLFDLPAFGESEGRRITFGDREGRAVSDAVLFLKRGLAKGQSVGLFGYSLGAASVLSAAGRYQAGDFVIALCPYASVNSLFRKQLSEQGLPSALFFPLVRLSLVWELGWNYGRGDPLRWAGAIRQPLLVFSAAQDREVPFLDGSLLVGLSPAKVRTLVLLPGGHGALRDSFSFVLGEVSAFLGTLGGVKGVSPSPSGLPGSASPPLRPLGGNPP